MTSEINSFIKNEFTNAIDYCLNQSEIKNYYNKHDKSESISTQSTKLGEEISTFLMKKIIKKITTHEEINVDIASNVKTKNRKRSTSSNLPLLVESKCSSGHKKTNSSSSSQKKFKYCYTDSDDSDSSSQKINSCDDEESSKSEEKIKKKKKRSRTFIPVDVKMQILKLVNKNPYIKLSDIRQSCGYNNISQQQINMWKSQYSENIDSSDDSNNIDNKRIINNWVYNKCIEQSNMSHKFNERLLKTWALEAKELYFKNDDSRFKFIPDDKWLDTFKTDYSIIEANVNEMYVIPKKLTEEELKGYMPPCDEEIELIEEVKSVNQVNNDSKKDDNIKLKPKNIVGINMNNIEMINMNKQKILNEENISQLSDNVDDFIDKNNVDPLQTVDVGNQLIDEVPEIHENALNIYTYSKCQEFSEKKIKYGDKEIREWAIDAAKLCFLPHSDFKPSTNWINKFKKINGIIGKPWDLRIDENTINNSKNNYDSNQNLLDLQMNDTDDDFFKSLESPSSSFKNLNIQKDKAKDNFDEVKNLGEDQNNKVDFVDLTIDDDDDDDNNNYYWLNVAANIKTELPN